MSANVASELRSLRKGLDKLRAELRAVLEARTWFREHRVANHYDLTPERRECALAAGAVFVPAKQQALDRRARRSSPQSQSNPAAP